MKDKIIDSFIDKESGLSRIVIQNKYGKFSGYSFCNEEDMPTFSKYTGARYAEIRANIKFYKERIKQEKLKLKAIQNLEKDIYYNCYILDSSIQKRINLAKRDYSNRIASYENLCMYLSNSISRMDEERQEILNRHKQDK